MPQLGRGERMGSQFFLLTFFGATCMIVFTFGGGGFFGKCHFLGPFFTKILNAESFFIIFFCPDVALRDLSKNDRIGA